MRLTNDIRAHAFTLAHRADGYRLTGERDLARACLAASAALFDAGAAVSAVEAREQVGRGRAAA